jgi:hypothetical protein
MSAYELKTTPWAGYEITSNLDTKERSDVDLLTTAAVDVVSLIWIGVDSLNLVSA